MFGIIPRLIEGQIIVIGTQLSHAIADEGKYGLAVFIDPLSETGYSIMQNVLADNQFTVVYDENIKNHLSELLINHTEANVHSAANAIITSIRGNIVQRPFSAPVMETVEMIRCEEENFDMDHIAGEIHLSKSRIAHIFSYCRYIISHDKTGVQPCGVIVIIIVQGAAIS